MRRLGDRNAASASTKSTGMRSCGPIAAERPKLHRFAGLSGRERSAAQRNADAHGLGEDRSRGAEVDKGRALGDIGRIARNDFRRSFSGADGDLDVSVSAPGKS